MRIIILTFLFTVMAVSAVNAQPDNLHEMGVKGYSLVLNMQFDEANKIFTEMIRIEPENVLGHLLLALSYGWIWKINDFDEKLGAKYQDHLTRACDIAEEMLDKNEDDVDALFFAGCTYGELTIYYMKTGKWIRAFINSRSGTAYMKKVLEKDPEYYDAYLGIGMSHCYTRIISSYSSTFAIIAGNTEGYREKGIGEIFLAASKGKYVSDEAKVILATSILTQEFGEDYIPAFNILTWKSEGGYTLESREVEGDNLAALPLIKELTGKYPQNHFFKLQLAECFLSLNKHDLALQTIEQLMLSETLKKNKYLYNRLYYIQGRTYAKLNEFEKAISAFKKTLRVIQLKARSLYYMGVVYEMMGEVGRARESYNKIEKTQGRLGIIYLRAKSRIENPYTPSQIEFYTGTNYIACGKYTEAAEIFSKLLGIELNKEKPDSAFLADLHFNITRVEYEMKEFRTPIGEVRGDME